MVKGKIPAAQDHLTGFDHFQRTGQRILRMMLVVSVYGDHAKTVRAVFEKPCKGRLQSSTLASVDLMMQKLHLRMGSCLLKVMEIFGFASVVDQNDICKACTQQSVDHSDQLFIRVQRG